MKAVLILFLLFLGALTSRGNPQIKECTQAEQREAMLAAPKDWKTFYSLFQRLGHCDDGAMAENFSDKVVRLLATDWRRVDDLRILAASDRVFQRFVLSHIDATTDENDLRRVIVNAGQRCPSKTKQLCRAIESNAKSALAQALAQDQQH